MDGLSSTVSNSYRSTMNEPAYYRIQAGGFVNERWVSRFWNMKAKAIQHKAGTTTTEMIGEMTGQEALMGLINILYNMGHVLIFVEQLTADQFDEVVSEEIDV